MFRLAVYSRYRLLKTSDFRLLRFRLLRFQNYVYSDAKNCLKTAAFRLGTQSYSKKKIACGGLVYSDAFTQIPCTYYFEIPDVEARALARHKRMY